MSCLPLKGERGRGGERGRKEREESRRRLPLRERCADCWRFLPDVAAACVRRRLRIRTSRRGKARCSLSLSLRILFAPPQPEAQAQAVCVIAKPCISRTLRPSNISRPASQPLLLSSFSDPNRIAAAAGKKSMLWCGAALLSDQRCCVCDRKDYRGSE